MEQGNIVKAYITKYWETQGIVLCDVEIVSSQAVKRFVDNPRFGGMYFYRNDYFFDKADAIAHVTKLRDKKIASLKKKLEKLESMDVPGLVNDGPLK